MKKYIIYFLLIILLFVIAFPLIFKIPCVHDKLSFLFSFTNTAEMKAAYIEFIGALLGSAIAIIGALYVQSKIDANEEKSKRKKYALIVYYDFKFAFDDLKKIYRDNKLKNDLSGVSGEEYVDLLCETACDGRSLYFDDKWIEHVAELSNYIENCKIQQIYKIYGQLCDLKQTLDRKDKEKLKSLYQSHLAEFIDCDWITFDIRKDYTKLLNYIYQFIS